MLSGPFYNQMDHTIQFPKYKTDGTRYGQGNIKVLEYYLDDSNSDVSAAETTTHLYIKYYRGKASQSEETTRKIKIYYELNGSSVIQTCRALGGDSHIWSRQENAQQNIFYSGGNVGINTDAPEERFHIKHDNDKSAKFKVVDTSSALVLEDGDGIGTYAGKDIKLESKGSNNSNLIFLQGEKYTKISMDNISNGACEAAGFKLSTSAATNKYFSYHNGQVEVVGGYPGVGANTCVEGFGQNVIFSVKNPNTVDGSNANLGLRTMGIENSATTIQFSDGVDEAGTNEWDGSLSYIHGSMGSLDSDDHFVFNINGGIEGGKTNGAQVVFREKWLKYKTYGGGPVKIHLINKEEKHGVIRFTGDSLHFDIDGEEDTLKIMKGTGVEILKNLKVTESIEAQTVTTPSDERFKKDIEKIMDPLSILGSVDGVRYNFRVNEFPDRKFSEERQLGVIAQQVEKVLPEIVSEDKDGYKRVSYQELIPVLIESIKQLERKNRILEKSLKKLEASVKKQSNAHK